MSAIEMKKTNAPDPPPKTPLLTGQPYLPKKNILTKKKIYMCSCNDKQMLKVE
jgi:hypothetical protein